MMNNDLISREALKKCAIPCEIQNGALTELAVPLYQIDNAPSVEPTFEVFKAICCEDCDKRPAGEWKLDDTEQFCYCSNCEDTYYPRPLDPSWHFCPHCGADMRVKDELNRVKDELEEADND